MTDHSQYRLGKHTPKAGPRAPRLFNHLMAALPKPAVDWAAAVKSFPMLANDKIGCCTSAAALHLAQVWLANASKIDWTPTDDNAIALYTATSDYPEEDDGTTEARVLQYWKETGIQTSIGTETILFASVNPQNPDEMKLAIENFGGVYIGVALPIAAQTMSTWDMSAQGTEGAGAPGSWGGHAVCIPKYDESVYTCVTWGNLLDITPAFINTYCDEAYVLISEDWLSDSGISPPGLNMASLRAEMASLSA
jgi:hypothetical protein